MWASSRLKVSSRRAASTFPSTFTCSCKQHNEVRSSPGRRAYRSCASPRGPRLSLCCAPVFPAAWGEHRLRDCVRVRLEASYQLPSDRFTKKPFDIAQKREFIDTNKRDRLAGCAGATCAVDAVHLVLRNVGADRS